MKSARIIVLAIALVAGGLAIYLASGLDSGNNNKPAAEPVAQLPTVDVLVAKNDVGVGQVITPEDMQWQTWTQASASASFIRRTDRSNAITDLAGSIVRAPFVAGEPIREQKLVKVNGSGFMAAILPSGKRAVSTEISAETGAGGFILPNDRVDVVLTKKEKLVINPDSPPIEVTTASTILSNVRVLAIDQAPKEKDGQSALLGKTATLELKPDEVGVLQKAHLQGSLSLALRSIADAEKAEKPVASNEGNMITIYRGPIATETLNCDPKCR